MLWQIMYQHGQRNMEAHAIFQIVSLEELWQGGSSPILTRLTDKNMT